MYEVKLYRSNGEIYNVKAETVYYNGNRTSSYLTLTYTLTENSDLDLRNLQGLEDFTLIEAGGVPFDNLHYCSSISCLMSDSVVWQMTFVPEKALWDE